MIFVLNLPFVPQYGFWIRLQRKSFDKELSIVSYVHEITKYGIHSFMQITLAVDKELTYN